MLLFVFVCLSPPEWFLFDLCVKYCIVTSSCVCCSFSPRPANLSACDSFWPLQKGQTRKGRSLDESWASDWLMAEWWKQCQGSRPRYRLLKIHGEFLHTHTHTDFTDWLTDSQKRAELNCHSFCRVKGAVVSRVSGALWELSRPLEDDCELQLLDYASSEGRQVCVCERE